MEKDTMINNLIIRQETEEDYKKTELMIMRSFWNKYWPGCTEHLLTRIIRDSQDYIPEISRIAEIDGQIVGAIYYTKAWIVDGNSRYEIRGKLIESSDFEKLGDEAALLRISEEFPEYRKVKVKEGFMQIFEQHLGVVESVENDIYNVRYWEKLIPAKLAGDINEKPKAGSDVKFKWNHGGESKITMVFKNLLEE